MQKQILARPATPEMKAAHKATDEAVMAVTTDRSHKAQAPEPLRPERRWPNPAELVKHFKEARDAHIAYIEKTPDDLRGHFGPFGPLGPIDAYQWILMLSSHTERHTAQINEVKADANFPKNQ